VPLPSKLSSASTAVPAFRPCLPNNYLAMDYTGTILFMHMLLKFYCISPVVLTRRDSFNWTLDDTN
jgi:hypothetical protein